MTYRCIVADPPWPQRGAGSLRGRRGWVDAYSAPSRQMPYSVMTVDEIAAMQVAQLADDDAHLYLWTTNRFLGEAFAVVEAWGFRYSTTLVWAKRTMGGGTGGDAFGISTEYVLFARRGSLPALRKIPATWFSWKRHYERGAPSHSSKPAGFYELVEQVSPGPYLELFARRMRMGWDAWGDQAPESIRWAGAS